MQKKWILFLLLAGILGCNLPKTKQPPPAEPQVGTVVAQTVSAEQTKLARTPLATPTKAATLTPTPATPTATITPTYSVPLLSLAGATNCRSGPGENYAIIATYPEGTQVEIVGRGAEGNYWIVADPQGKGTCWLAGDYATESGSTWTVPTVMPPPTPTPVPPSSPSLKHYDFLCTWNGVNNTLNITILWTDRANNESGYRIYRNGVVVADLAANTTAYDDTFAVASGVPVNYAIEAYNAAGASGRASFSETCP